MFFLLYQPLRTYKFNENTTLIFIAYLIIIKVVINISSRKFLIQNAVVESWLQKKTSILSSPAQNVLCSVDGLAGDLP